jgi:hypothetical protein
MMEFVRSVSDASAEVAGEVLLTSTFETVEIDLLRLIVGQLAEMLDETDADALASSTDPAILRLLPDAYSDDPEAAAEFRRFTGAGLLEQKVRNARAVRGTLNGLADPVVTVVLDAAAVASWLRTLTDLRLTLAARLNIAPDGAMQTDDDQARYLADIYGWLGMVQESLVYAIDV